MACSISVALITQISADEEPLCGNAAMYAVVIVIVIIVVVVVVVVVIIIIIIILHTYTYPMAQVKCTESFLL